MCGSQLDPGRLAFSSSVWDLWLGREGEGVLWPEVRKWGSGSLGRGERRLGAGEAGSHGLWRVAAPGKQGLRAPWLEESGPPALSFTSGAPVS